MSVETLAEQPLYEVTPMPLVMSAAETTAEGVANRHAVQFIGSVAMREEVQGPSIERPIDSLQDAIQKAANGDPEARRNVKINAKTIGIEQTIKTGHVGAKVPLFFTEQGELFQYRQSLDSVQANSLRVAEGDPIMQPRTEAEVRNKFRIETLHEQGYFDEGYSLVVLSLAEDHPEFFTETMSCSIQVTSKNEDGLTTEPAFVAGIKEPGGEQHDMETVTRFYAMFGIDIRGMTRAEIIDTPLLIHNSLIGDGAIDVVEMLDDCAGGTFFGENKPRQDYLEYKKICAEREERFEPKAEKVTDQIISEYRSIHTRVMATQRLHKLSEAQMVEQAIGDTDIDPRVFGPAAPYIERARIAYQQGEADQLLVHMKAAKSKAQTSSCPGSGIKSLESLSGEDSQDSDEDCEFVSKKCPECGAKNVKTKVTKNKITGSCGCSKSR